MIVGAHARPGDFDPVNEGNLFHADWARGTITRVRLDGDNNVLSSEEWATNAGFPVDISFGPDGALYYASRGINRIRRIEYVGGTNRQPVAVATATPGSGNAPLTVFLDGRESFDPDEDPLTHTWFLGDGEGRVGPTTVRTYPMGVYEVEADRRRRSRTRCERAAGACRVRQSSPAPVDFVAVERADVQRRRCVQLRAVARPIPRTGRSTA